MSRSRWGGQQDLYKDAGLILEHLIVDGSAQVRPAPLTHPLTHQYDPSNQSIARNLYLLRSVLVLVLNTCSLSV